MYLASVKKMNSTILLYIIEGKFLWYLFFLIFSVCQKVFEALAHRDSKIEILLALKKFYKTKKIWTPDDDHELIWPL